MSNQQPISWQAPEFRHYQKGYAWYVTLAAMSILIVGYFAVNQDYFAAVCLAIMAGFIYFFARQAPQVVVIELNQSGIAFGELFFPYKQIKHFWIVYNNTHRTINLHTTAMLNNMMILELEDQDPETVRQFLLRHVPEHSETEETPVQRIIHRFKF
jgi:uncharacterized membrane protein YobD (UPF0266 family)